MTNKITDRAVFIMETEFWCNYELDGENLTERTLKGRVRKLLQTHIDRCYSNENSVPFVMVTEISNKEPYFADDNGVTKLRTSCTMTMCVEDADNNPEQLAKEMTMLFFDTIKFPSFKVNKAYPTPDSIAIKDESCMRGYVQLDNSVFIPIT